MKYKYNLASPDRYKILKDFALENKRHATEAESMLWAYLSKKQLGEKFNRQHIIGDYIADFACLKKDLIIEVDGGYHSEYNQIKRDENRTEVLSKMGFNVIRFSNEEVLFNIEKVLEVIRIELNRSNE